MEESKNFADILISFHSKEFDGKYEIFDKETNSALSNFKICVEYTYELLDHESFEPIKMEENDDGLEARFFAFSKNDEAYWSILHIHQIARKINDGKTFEPLQKFVQDNIEANSFKIVLDAYIAACYQFFSQVCEYWVYCNNIKCNSPISSN